MKKAFHVFLPCCFVFTLLFVCLAAQGDDINPNLTMSPFKIILNAKCLGTQQDIQAILDVSPTVYENICGDIELRFGKVSATIKAASFRYCYIDTNLLVSFDRAEVQQYLVDHEIIGDTTATVTGTYKKDDVTLTFVGTDSVEVVSPSKK